MLQHEFGILPAKPSSRKRFDKYEPEKYNCISIHDDYIFPLLPKIDHIKTYSHALRNPETSLEYYGITLIPPKSLSEFENILLSEKKDIYDELINLISRARNERKYLIHFGI